MAYAPPPGPPPAPTGHPPAKSSKAAFWDKTKKNANVWFEKAGKPVNALTNKLGAESFWPMALDQEADKAARILRSFCIDGFETTHPKDKKHKLVEHIPPEVIRNCTGLTIFTTMRMGLHWSGAGGSGVIVSKLPNGQWSPPSGILIHTLGWGLMAGADIYDCVAVINNAQGMDGFTRVRATLGGEISAAVGPLGGGSTLDSEVFRRPAPVWTYTKSKGLYAGVQIDGTVIVERGSENERFYRLDGVRHAQILAAQVQVPPGAAVQLWETLQAAEGAVYDSAALPPPFELNSGHHDIVPPREESHREYHEATAHHPQEYMYYK